MKRPRAWGRGVVLFAILVAALDRTIAGPENTVIVVNADSWASTYIANDYIQARGIPPWNVIYISDMPSFESLPVEEFRQKILSPVLQTLDSRGLAAQTDAILYSADFPTMIDLSGDVGQEKLSPALTPYGSINGLTFLYQAVVAKSIATLDLGSNYYARRAALPPETSKWSAEERDAYTRATRQTQECGKQAVALRAKPDPAASAALQEKVEGLIETLEKLQAKHPEGAELNYNLGCALALGGRPGDAVRSLNRAADSGWFEVRNAAADEDLMTLRGRPDFEKLLARTRSIKFEPQPAIGFRGALSWLPMGQAAAPDAGRRYLISTVLACTSGRGTSVREALAGLRRSVSADSRMPKGTVYFEKNADVRSTTREWGFDSAAEKLKSLGVNAVVENGVLPLEKLDVIGTMVGSEGFNWAASKSRILPGAICEHLTSCGGMMSEGDIQTPLSEFTRNGAAGASGTVSEPFAIQAKFPTPFIHSFYAQGCTLGEAFYQSITGPYQLLIVGDALCKPWGKRLVVKTGDLTIGGTLKGSVKITPKATSPDHIEAALFELYIDGKRGLMVKSGGSFDFDTRGVPDGAHDITIVANAGDSVGSQGRLTLPVEIRNTEETFSVSAPGARERAWDKPIEVTVNQPGAKEILLMANIRIVARLTGDSGKVTVDPRVLGQGPVRLIAVAVREGTGSKQIIGKPIELTINPPAPLRAQSLPAGRALADEIELRIGKRAPVGAKRADGDWLTKAGVENGDSFSVEGWFEVPEDDVYQFQLRGGAEIENLTVDGAVQTWPHGKTWWFVPVHLAKGLHRVNIAGKGTAQSTLEIRFGGSGAQKLDGARFKRLLK